jgi:hypothetical protein
MNCTIWTISPRDGGDEGSWIYGPVMRTSFRRRTVYWLPYIVYGCSALTNFTFLLFSSRARRSKPHSIQIGFFGGINQGIVEAAGIHFDN